MWQPDYFKQSVLRNDLFERMWFNMRWNDHSHDLPLTIFSAGHSWWPKQRSLNEQNRQFWGIEIVIGGDAVFIQNGRKNIVRQGEVFLCKFGEDQFFGPGPSGYLHKRQIVISGSSLKHLLTDSGLIQYDTFKLNSPEQVAVLIALSKSACRILALNQPEGLYELARIVFNFILELRKTILPVHAQTAIQKATYFIDTHLEKSLTLNQIADAAHVSASHLIYLFNKHLNETPINYFLQQKMVYAGNILKHTPKSIKEIAEELGFADQFLFSKQFKRVMGKSPREFRQSH